MSICHKTSYFVADLKSGYCTYCGKIIYNESGITSQLPISTPSTSYSPKEYDVLFSYTKSNYEYSRTVIVNISGPISRQIAVNVNEPLLVKLPEGQYQIIANVHVSAGVNSTDVMGSKMIDLHSSTKVSMNASGLFSRKLIVS